MKSIRTLITISLVMCAVAFLMTIGDWMALNDISKDYVSKDVVVAHLGDSIDALPDWSETRMEWQMVNISGLARIAYFALSAVTLAACLKIAKKSNGRSEVRVS